MANSKNPKNSAHSTLSQNEICEAFKTRDQAIAAASPLLLENGSVLKAMIKIAKEKEIPQKRINNVIAKVGNANIFYTQTFPRALAQAEQIVREYDLELSRGNAISRERKNAIAQVARELNFKFLYLVTALEMAGTTQNIAEKSIVTKLEKSVKTSIKNWKNARDKVIRSFYKACEKEAMNYFETTTKFDRQDIAQEIILRIIDAFDNFDMSKKVRFSTFIHINLKIKGPQIAFSKMSTISVPENAKRALADAQKMVLKNNCSFEQALEMLDEKTKKFAKLAYASRTTVELDREIFKNSKKSETLGDRIPEPDLENEISPQGRSFKEWLNDLAAEQSDFALACQSQCNSHEIAQKYNRSCENVEEIRRLLRIVKFVA